MTERFASVYIGDVYLYYRSGNCADSILQGYGCVRISTSIQDNAIDLETYLMNLIDQLAFDVRLEIGDFYHRIMCTEFGKIIFKRNRTVDRRFTLPQKIDVRAIYYLYLHNTFFVTFVPT